MDWKILKPLVDTPALIFFPLSVKLLTMRCIPSISYITSMTACFRIFLFTILALMLIGLSQSCAAGGEEPPTVTEEAMPEAIVSGWARLSGDRKGKIIFAQPPDMIILDLTTAKRKKVPGITVAGAKGRRHRGKSPRPSWAPDGKRFVYRFDGRIFVSDEAGNRQHVKNDRMDCSNETRWTWFRKDGIDWLAGPSEKENVILVKVDDPAVVKIAYGGEDVEKHCELTGTGNYVVYDNDSDIHVTPFGSREPGIKISSGQSCRPCAAPDDRVAWLPSPHDRYKIHNASNGMFIRDLSAPENEEMYRMNWSNHPDFAVHMFGSRGNTRIQVRKISTGEHVYVGNGWDPDLWVGN